MYWLVSGLAFTVAVLWARRSDKKARRASRRSPRLRDPSYKTTEDWFTESKTHRPF